MGCKDNLFSILSGGLSGKSGYSGKNPDKTKDLLPPKRADSFRFVGISDIKIRVGTSGFGYREWLGDFYPPKLAGPKMLPYFAERIATVEINYTFRRTPSVELLGR